MKDQEIIVDSPPPRESMGQSSGSTPTLPYSHRQAFLPISISSPLTIPTASFPTSVLQNVTTEHFPLVSSSSSSLYHSSLQPSSISFPDPPPYPSTILLTPLGPTLYDNPFSPIYPHTTPLFSSNPLVGSSLSFPQQSFPSQPTLNPWSFSHTIYNPKPVYTSTSYPFNSNTFSSFSTLPIDTSTTFSNTNPIFTTISNTLKSSSDSLPKGGSLEVGQEDGVGATPTIPPENLIPKFLTLTHHFSAALLFLLQMLLGLVIPDIFVLMIL